MLIIKHHWPKKLKLRVWLTLYIRLILSAGLVPNANGKIDGWGIEHLPRKMGNNNSYWAYGGLDTVSPERQKFDTL